MLLLYKHRYQTCLELLDTLRRESPELAHEKLSYNGILDPMAEGIVPVLVGEYENRHRGLYTGARKEYDVSVLCGISTDSGDLLGKVAATDFTTAFSLDRLIYTVLQYPSHFLQTVPMHSHRKVRGKRLWWWMLHGIDIPPTERPKNCVTIYERSHILSDVLACFDLRRDLEVMRTVFHDRFRMPAVWESWQFIFSQPIPCTLPVVTFRLVVSSGFYVRAFIFDISSILCYPLMVYRLVRKGVYFSHETNVASS